MVTPTVDIFIGIDYADLYYAFEELTRRPGELVEKLTPLGWTCLGKPRPIYKALLLTIFACTYFVRDVSEIEKLDENLRKVWEKESVLTTQDPPLVRIEEQMALNKVKRSFTFETQIYWVGVPWKNDDLIIPNNYKTTFQRLENTEKRLKKIPAVAKTYNDCLERYVEKATW